MIPTSAPFLYFVRRLVARSVVCCSVKAVPFRFTAAGAAAVAVVWGGPGAVPFRALGPTSAVYSRLKSLRHADRLGPRTPVRSICTKAPAALDHHSKKHRDCDLELRFEEVIVGDTRMLRTPLPFGCETQPFFLGLSQHAGLLASVRPSLRAGGGPRLLVLTGPVKCSKSSVLHSILPALIVQEYNRSGLPGGGRPFIVPFTFSCFSSPEVAAQQLEIGLRDALAGLGVRIQSHYVAEQALLQLPNTLAHAAQAVHEAGRSLWLLVDECPVPFVRAACDNPERTASFAAALKQCISVYAEHSAIIAIAGCGMDALLNQASMLPPISSLLKNNIKIVSLDATPTPAAAAAMATQLVAATQLPRWMEAERSMIAKGLVQQLAPTERDCLASPRPALMMSALYLLGHKAHSPMASAGKSAAELLLEATAGALEQLRLASHEGPLDDPLA